MAETIYVEITKFYDLSINPIVDMKKSFCFWRKNEPNSVFLYHMRRYYEFESHSKKCFIEFIRDSNNQEELLSGLIKVIFAIHHDVVINWMLDSKQEFKRIDIPTADNYKDIVNYGIF